MIEGASEALAHLWPQIYCRSLLAGSQVSRVFRVSFMPELEPCLSWRDNLRDFGTSSMLLANSYCSMARGKRAGRNLIHHIDFRIRAWHLWYALELAQGWSDTKVPFEKI